MIRLISQIIGLAEDIMLGWVIPLFIMAVMSTVFAVIIAANQIIAAIVIAAVTSLLMVYCYHRQAWWQLGLYLALGGPYILFALIAPEWAILWGLIIAVISLIVIAIVPGAILPGARRIILGAIIFLTIVHVALAWATWQSYSVFPLLLALLLIAVGGHIFNQGARPHEIRRAQRALGRLVVILGVILILGAILPSELPSLTLPRPIQSMYDYLTNKIEARSLSARREVVGQQAKTEALESISPLITSLHRERWLKGAEEIPNLPLSSQEWKELGIDTP